MGMLRGETLEARIKAEGPFTAGEVDSLLWPLLEGLQQVHEACFVPRDIRPANVFIGAEGKPTLIDFGASRAAMVGRTAAGLRAQPDDRHRRRAFAPGQRAAANHLGLARAAWPGVPSKRGDGG